MLTLKLTPIDSYKCKYDSPSPQWPVQLRKAPFLFVISTITMLFICTFYTVNFISFKQIYFINICSSMFSYPGCFHTHDVFFCVCLALSTAWRANPESWQTWCQNANFAPSKEIYQISGLHTRYRFSLQGSGRHEQDGEKGDQTQPKREREKRKTRCKRKVLDITKTPMGRLLLERRSRLSNFYPVAISGSLKIVLWVLCFTSTYRQFHAVKVWGCKTVRYDANPVMMTRVITMGLLKRCGSKWSWWGRE